MKETTISSVTWPTIAPQEAQFFDSQGTPLRDFEVRVFPKISQKPNPYIGRQAYVTNQDGKVKLPALQGGLFTLLFTKSGYRDFYLDSDQLSLSNTIAVKKNHQLSRSIRMVDEFDYPLADVRAQLRAIGSEEVIRFVSNSDGLVTFTGLNPNAVYRFEALAQGRELSLKKTNRIAGPGSLVTFRFLPLRSIPIDLAPAPWSLQEFTGILITSPNDLGRRRAFFSSNPGKSIDLTVEQQRITIYRRGCRSQAMTWDPLLRRIVANFKPGPSLSVLIGADFLGSTLELIPQDLSLATSHQAPLRSAYSRFATKIKVNSQQISFGPQCPGRYEIRLVTAGKVAGTWPVTLDHTDLNMDLRN